MNFKELRKAVKECSEIRVWVNAKEHDGVYLTVNKKAVLESCTDEDAIYDARMTENGTLFIA